MNEVRNHEHHEHHHVHAHYGDLQRIEIEHRREELARYLERMPEQPNYVNWFSDVANLLGLKLEERFGIDGMPGIYFFDRFGMYDDFTKVPALDLLLEVLSGMHRIIKLPVKPKIGDTYYYCNSINGGCDSKVWDEDMTDLEHFAVGNTFATATEAGSYKADRLQSIYDSGVPAVHF